MYVSIAWCNWIHTIVHTAVICAYVFMYLEDESGKVFLQASTCSYSLKSESYAIPVKLIVISDTASTSPEEKLLLLYMYSGTAEVNVKWWSWKFARISTQAKFAFAMPAFACARTKKYRFVIPTWAGLSWMLPYSYCSSFTMPDTVHHWHGDIRLHELVEPLTIYHIYSGKVVGLSPTFRKAVGLYPHQPYLLCHPWGEVTGLRKYYSHFEKRGSLEFHSEEW